jgi:hypothetical protein
MNFFNRRDFLKASAASLLLEKAAPSLPVSAQQLSAGETNGTVRIEGAAYVFEWSARDDRFRLLDKTGRLVTSGVMQPAVTIATDSGAGAPRCTSGKAASHEVKDGKLTVNYEGVNGRARLRLTWRFDEAGLWLDPIVYESAASEEIVAVHYFAECKDGQPEPSLESSYLVVPGISESSAISPVVPPGMGLDVTLWLGHGGSGSGLLQQWGLPAHYFCGFHLNSGSAAKAAMLEHLSSAFCCGLAELPAGDLYFEIRGERHSPVLNYRSDLWKQLRSPGTLSLGAKWRWAMGSNYYEAIRHYYLDLVQSGIIHDKSNSAHKNSVVLSPQFNTWGAEVASSKDWGRYDEPLLLSIYEGLKASGMKPGTFVIDAKWEGKYGLLEHSSERFPHFEEILQRIRSEGHLLGMWAAFMRCEDPRDLGLTTAHMLRGADGKPIVRTEGPVQYYLFDFTQPEVQQVLARLARKFVRRYQPDLVKFDFGYELPALAEGAPKDMKWAGERLLAKGLEVVVEAMRQEKPDLVVMYYSLSPLFNEYFDLHSPDDLFMCDKEYDLEANRRFFFSSLLGEIGMPTYGSGGYDWSTMPEIWFDSAAVGTLGSLNSFSGDEENESPTPERVAKYNGLAQLLRPTNTFSIRPIGADYVSSTRGARSPSWARLENDEVVLLALRACGGLGGKGTGKYMDVAETSASVVLASKTAEGIERALRLAVVPYGDGELTIRRAGDEMKPAEVIEHAWGNRPGKRVTIPVQNGRLAIPLRERIDDGSPVEWIEVNI